MKPRSRRLPKAEKENSVIRIRAYEPADREDVLEIWNAVIRTGKAFPQTEELKTEEADDFFNSQTFTGVAVDDENGEIVGLYALRPNGIGHCAHLCCTNFAVKASMRGRHIGETLAHDCMKRAKAAGFRILQFNSVVATNTGAIRLYEKLGFTRLGTIPDGFLNSDGKTYTDIVVFYAKL